MVWWITNRDSFQMVLFRNICHSLYVNSVGYNSDENLADAWGDTSFLVFPNTAQLPPYGFFRVESEPDWSANPVVAIVVGIAKQGNETLAETRVRVELSEDASEIFGDPGENLALPAPLTIWGTLTQFEAFDSKPFKINGGDNPAIVASRSSDVDTIKNAIPSKNRGNYTGAGIASPSVTSSSFEDNIWGDPDALRNLVTAAKNQGVTVQSFNDDCRNSEVCVVQGVGGNRADADIGNSTLNTKLLIVTGNLSMSAITFNGVILVLGGTLNWSGGGGGGALNGALYVANVTQPTTGSWEFDSTTGVSVLMTGGGNASLTYNGGNVSDALDTVSGSSSSGWSVSSWHEIL